MVLVREVLREVEQEEFLVQPLLVKVRVRLGQSEIDLPLLMRWTVLFFL